MQVLARPKLACSLRLALVGLAALVFGLAGAGRALAQDSRNERVERAKEHYEAGSRYYQQGAYADAIRELKAAYDLTGETTLLYNIAKSHEKLGDYEQAIRHYQDYVDMTGSITATDRAEVERTIQDLLRRKEELLPELVVNSTPRGADIYIDNRTKIRGQTPGRFRIEPGPHQLYLEKKGYEPLDKPFVMPSGKGLNLDFTLSPVAEYGSIQIVANVSGARVFIDGKNVGITPYGEMPSLKIGFHQVILEREGYLRWEQRVAVDKGRTTLVTADMVPIEPPSSAPAVLGWTSLVLGGLTIGGGVVAGYFAEKQFNDTEDFKTLHNLELAGYVSGGVLLTAAVTMIVYDLVRESPRDSPAYSGYSGLGPPGGFKPGIGFGLDPGRRTLLFGAGLSF